jgi:hypothetical protein
MGKISKTFAILLTLIITMSCLTLLTVKPANAQTIPKPSVPEFILKFVDASYDVPITYTTDPYTGQNITHQGYHVNNTILLIAIQNQPLVYQFNGNESFGSESFYYNIQVKGHYAENWTQLYLNDELPMPNVSSTQTSLTLGVLGESGLNINLIGITVPFDGKEDFRVQAMIGYFHKIAVPFSGWVFDGQTSDWSTTQTIAIPTSLSSPNPTPTIPELSWFVIVPLLVGLFAMTVILRHRKTSNLNK